MNVLRATSHREVLYQAARAVPILRIEYDGLTACEHLSDFARADVPDNALINFVLREFELAFYDLVAQVSDNCHSADLSELFTCVLA